MSKVLTIEKATNLINAIFMLLIFYCLVETYFDATFLGDF